MDAGIQDGAYQRYAPFLQNEASEIEDVSFEDDDGYVFVDVDGIPCGIHVNAQAAPSPHIDGGYAWVVLAVSWCVLLVVDGVVQTFSAVFLPVIVYDCKADFYHVVMVRSVQQGLYMGATPIAYAFGEEFGYRLVGVLGSFFAAFGFFVSTASNGFSNKHDYECDKHNIDFMIVTYSAIGGIGLSFLYMSATVPLNRYFDKKRLQAVGIASTGSSVGIFVVPIITDTALRHFTSVQHQQHSPLNLLRWEKCIWILGGFIILAGILTMFLRPLESEASQSNEIRGIGHYLKKQLKLKVLVKPFFIMAVFITLFSTIGETIPLTFISNLAGIRGNSSHDDAMYSTSTFMYMGLSNLVCRPLVGCLMCKFKDSVPPSLLLAVLAMFMGIASMLVQLMSAEIVIVYAVFFGVLLASHTSVTTEILTNNLGSHNLAGALGFLCLVKAVTVSFTLPLAGYLRDHTGTYSSTFQLAGGALLAMAALCLLSFCIKRQGSRCQLTRDRYEDIS